jgi:hypothetical protein
MMWKSKKGWNEGVNSTQAESDHPRKEEQTDHMLCATEFNGHRDSLSFFKE